MFHKEIIHFLFLSRFFLKICFFHIFFFFIFPYIFFFSNYEWDVLYAPFETEEQKMKAKKWHGFKVICIHSVKFGSKNYIIFFSTFSFLIYSNKSSGIYHSFWSDFFKWQEIRSRRWAYSILVSPPNCALCTRRVAFYLLYWHSPFWQTYSNTQTRQIMLFFSLLSLSLFLSLSLVGQALS